MDRRVSRLPSESRRIGFCMLSTTGGSSIMAGEIAWRLRQAGHTVLTCHCASDAAPSENATALSKDYAFHVQRNLDIDRSFIGGIDTCSQVLGWHKATRFDVLHVHSVPVFGLAALHLKRLRGVPYIVTFHGTVPVVAPALGGIVEVIGDDWPLLVRDTADPRAYAHAMSAAARPEMRMLARDRAASVLHRFSAPTQVDRYLGLYDQALGRST